MKVSADTRLGTEVARLAGKKIRQEIAYQTKVFLPAVVIKRS